MPCRCVLVLVVLALGAARLSAEHADISVRVGHLDVDSGKTSGEVRASADHEPPAGGARARAVFKAKAGEPLLLQFFFTNTYPHDVLKDVRVRYFVVRVDKLRQAELPDLAKGTVTEGEFTMPLRPRTRVGARQVFRLPGPGVYILRMDTVNTHSDHEHFAAIDLLVE